MTAAARSRGRRKEVNLWRIAGKDNQWPIKIGTREVKHVPLLYHCSDDEIAAMEACGAFVARGTLAVSFSSGLAMGWERPSPEGGEASCAAEDQDHRQCLCYRPSSAKYSGEEESRIRLTD